MAHVNCCGGFGDELRAAGYPEAAAIGEVVEMLEEGVCVPALVECVE